MDRRDFLVRTGLTFAAGALAALPAAESVAASTQPQTRTPADSWESIRAQFNLSTDYIHLGGLLLASHPTPVRRAIETHRYWLDDNPVHYVQDRGPGLEAQVLRAAGAYLGGRPADIALTDSTTMGLGLLYNGLDVSAGQEILTTTHDFYATHEAIRLKATRTGASVRSVTLYDRPESASAEAIVSRLIGAVTPRTRVVAVTWVHSSTGVKLPIGWLAEALLRVNANRTEADRALLCVDGVHGFGVEDATMTDLGCDFFVAGCHKWIFGPRGTGLVWGHPDSWPALTPTIPSFSGQSTYGAANTPGGYHSFEHRWALNDAFNYHLQIGKAAVAARIHDLNRQFKEGLAAIPGVHVYTPMSDDLSAGLVCFDVAGLSAAQVVARLRAQGVIITQTPYANTYPRVAPGLINSPAEVDAALRAIRAIAS